MHRPIRMIGNGKGSQPVVFVDDLIDLMMTCATHPAAAGEVFNCAIDPSPTVKEYVHAYGKLVGNETWLGIPANLVATLGSVIIPFQKKGTYGHHLFKNVRMMNRNVRYHMDKAQRLLDWAPRYDVKSGVAATVPWLRSRGSSPHEEERPPGAPSRSPYCLPDTCLTSLLRGQGQDRTGDPRFFRPVLYQLSYLTPKLGGGDGTRTRDLRLDRPA